MTRLLEPLAHTLKTLGLDAGMFRTESQSQLVLSVLKGLRLPPDHQDTHRPLRIFDALPQICPNLKYLATEIRTENSSQSLEDVLFSLDGAHASAN